ncbi:hypothetical protein F5X68DRAFT_277301 [Plectosphaerella plurivora]|uniref:Uncharacterized protein n=1 Tax=Plectosphaerella plurivora TaxID=936078 RepID=A0A9P8V7B5_9PEZI|nr:hypothetical protein F5X68DRAFT_277301 [Plectosphaerella plurivora]
MRAQRKPAGKLSLLASLGEVLGISSRPSTARRGRPKSKRHINLRGPSPFDDDGSADSEEDYAPRVFIKRKGHSSTTSRRLRRRTNDDTDSASDSDASIGKPTKPSASSSATESITRSPQKGLYRLTAADLLQSTYSLYNHHVGQEPAPISESEFFKTVAELEKDYSRRSGPPKQPPSGCGIRRATKHHLNRAAREGTAPWKNFCGQCLKDHSAGLKYPPAQHGHLCSCCGFARSAEFHRRHPIQPGDRPVPNICRICRDRRNARSMNPTDTLLGTNNLAESEGGSMRSASPGGFTDRLPPAEDRPVSRQERRRQERGKTQKPAPKIALKPPPVTPQRQKQKTRKASYKVPTVEDASSSSEVESEEESSDESDDEPAPVKPRKPCRKIPSPLVSDTKEKTQAIFHREPAQDVRPRPPRPDSGYASGVSSGRRTSFNARVDVRTFATPDEDTRQDTRRNSRPSTAPDSSQSYNSWGTPSTPAFNAFSQAYPRTAAPETPRDSERLRRQMYEGGVSSLAQEYLRKSSPPPSPTSDLHRSGYSDLAQEYLSPTPSRQHRPEKGHAFSSSRGTQGSTPTWSQSWTHHRPSTAPSFQSSASDFYPQSRRHTAVNAPSYTSQTLHSKIPKIPKLPKTGFVTELADDESISGGPISAASTKVHTGNDSSPLKPGVVPGAVRAA